MPDESLEVTFAAGELHAFCFQHSLLFVGGQNHATRRAATLRVNDAMPWRLFFVRAMHHETHGARRVTFAQDDGNLSVSHYPAARNPTHQFVDAFAILPVRLCFLLHNS